ncbi:hypothetical protein ODJ79_19900 [Actinoplanes sp. KI2]|uniref:hypothetical protein n=1 Tax=Actinoplanes sp. KI2 TaxID=2983315 RepID=UPI0021D5DA23|nr:hypothetical protein [Actinoplanes sp. KI2]MCU7725994.1 hypothetical protein [Actinoplanes sp. KI2]
MSGGQMSPMVTCFAPDEVEILEQITGEANNFGAARLEPYGCTVNDVNDLVAVLQQKPLPPTGVCFAFVEPGSPVAEGQRPLDLAVVRWWKPVVEMVIKGHSPKELYYRTGFDFEEIRAAVERIPTTPQADQVEEGSDA